MTGSGKYAADFLWHGRAAMADTSIFEDQSASIALLSIQKKIKEHISEGCALSMSDIPLKFSGLLIVVIIFVTFFIPWLFFSNQLDRYFLKREKCVKARRDARTLNKFSLRLERILLVSPVAKCDLAFMPDGNINTNHLEGQIRRLERKFKVRRSQPPYIFGWRAWSDAWLEQYEAKQAAMAGSLPPRPRASDHL